MKIIIDDRPAKNGEPAFYAIRLHPETNKEMADLERPIVIKHKVHDYIRVTQDEIHYAIIFKDYGSIN